jgi:hypothetical protein
MSLKTLKSALAEAWEGAQLRPDPEEAVDASICAPGGTSILAVDQRPQIVPRLHTSHAFGHGTPRESPLPSIDRSWGTVLEPCRDYSQRRSSPLTAIEGPHQPGHVAAIPGV